MARLGSAAVTFAELSDWDKDKVLWKAVEIGSTIANTRQGARRKRIRRGAAALLSWVAGNDPARARRVLRCLHVRCDEEGYCDRCGRVWPESGPERLPFE